MYYLGWDEGREPLGTDNLSEALDKWQAFIDNDEPCLASSLQEEDGTVLAYYNGEQSDPYYKTFFIGPEDRVDRSDYL